MPYRTPVFKSKLDGRWYIRPYDDYQAPVLGAPGPQWVRTVARINIVASWFLPRWVQRRLDVRPDAAAYWAKVRKQERARAQRKIR